MSGKSGSSFREQVLYFYIQRLFPDALNRYKHETVGEIDIFIPSETTGIEYDGGYWHKKKIGLDNEKNQRAKDEGIRLIRIREFELPPTENAFGEISLDRYSDRNYDVEYLNYIFLELGNIINNDRVRSFSITEERYKNDLHEIYSRIFDVPIEPNLSDMCGIELWDKEYNGELSPYNIPEDEWAYAILRCKNNQNVVLPRYQRDFKEACREGRKGGCDNCVGGLVCPLIQWCHSRNYEKDEIYDCEYVEKQVRKMISKGISYGRLEKGCHLDTWLWLNSSLGIKLVKEILALPENDKKREKYYKFFGYKYKEDGIGISGTTIHVRNEEEKQLVEILASQLRYVKLRVSISPAILCRNDNRKG